jgi:hypothetical protein
VFAVDAVKLFPTRAGCRENAIVSSRGRISESWRLFACWVSPDRGVTVSSVISATLSSGRPNGDFRYGDAKAEMFERRLEKSPGDDFFSFASPGGTLASAEGDIPGMSSSERRVASFQSARNSASLSPIFNLSSAFLM